MFRVQREIQAREGLREPGPPGLDERVQGRGLAEGDQGVTLRRTFLARLQALQVGDRGVQVRRRRGRGLPGWHIDGRGPLRRGDAVDQGGGEVGEHEGRPLLVIECHTGGAVVRGEESLGVVAPACGNPGGNRDKLEGDMRLRRRGRVVVAAAAPVRQGGVGEGTNLGAAGVDLVVRAGLARRR